MRNVQHLTRKVGYRFRVRRVAPVIDMIEEAFQRRGEVRILDMGGTRDYWRIVPETLLQARSVTITLLNINGSSQGDGDDRFRAMKGDACALPDLADNAFDIVHSNSVIEHVGTWRRMTQFAAEVRRLAPCYFVQTPYFWFPLEPHFVTPLFHWLPRPWRVGLIRRWNLGQWQRQEDLGQAVLAAESAVLLDRAMFRYLFPDAAVSFEKVVGLPKSMVAIRKSAPV